MIHKIERLTSIGKFRNYSAAGQVNFHKVTLIYGDNGSGKTTLTSVFRSATTNNPQVIRSRISTNHTAAQAAQIVEVGTPNVFHTFGTTGWTIPLPNVEIFDIHFINDNVYSGFEFGDGQKKQLHQFVVGASGIAVQQQIETNKTAKTTSRATIATLEQQIITAVGNAVTSGAMLNELVALPATSAVGIAPLIVSADLALTNARANSIIQNLQNLAPLTPFISGIDFNALKIDLQTTTETIQEQLLNTLFSDHCQDLTIHKITNPETWLEQGFNYLKLKGAVTEGDLNCPFCMQSINSSMDIIRAYATLFNEEFNALTTRIQNHLNDIQSFNLVATTQALNNAQLENNRAISLWTTHLPETAVAPNYNFVPEESALQIEMERLLAIVRHKVQNPSASVDVEAVVDFERSVAGIGAGIITYNQEVTNYNIEITSFKTGIQTVIQAEAELARLKRIEQRFNPATAVLCEQLTAERVVLRTLETQYSTLSEQQQSLASAFLTTYSTRINYYLNNIFKTSFLIEDVVHVAPRGQARESKIGYRLTIDGLDISFQDGQPFSARECLSEGDKSTIALAFFLAKLDNDANCSDKVLIFDDPLSSLDTNRRTYTVGIIRALVTQMKQVIVLSHNEYFLHEISRDFGAALLKTLRVTENFATRASILEVCDLDSLVKNDYFKHFEALENFRTSPDHAMKDIVIGWMRNILEAHLRFKYYSELRAMGGVQTFGALITFLERSAVVFRDMNRVQVIADLRLLNSVSWRPHHGDPMPDFGSLSINPTSMSAAELDNLIQDTLNLINARL
jgi:wobble nucleotide-excising tRNase